MNLEIKDPEVDQLARELAHTTGETLPQAVINALRERLEREKARQTPVEPLADLLWRIGQECAALPVLDNRPPEDIIGYDANGVPA